MYTVTVYLIAYILVFSLPDGVREVHLKDNLIIWNVPDSRVRDWVHKQHFAELGYEVEGGQNSLVYERVYDIDKREHPVLRFLYVKRRAYGFLRPPLKE